MTLKPNKQTDSTQQYREKWTMNYESYLELFIPFAKKLSETLP